MIRRRAPAVDLPQRDRPVDVESMWTTLRVVNDWIRHLDAKAAVTVAAAGVAAGLLYNLVKSGNPGGPVASWVGGACAAALLLAVGLAGSALLPRVRPSPRLGRRAGTGTPNPLFFGDVTRGWSDAECYTADLEKVVHDPLALSRLIGQQTFVNSDIATRKSTRAGWGLTALLVGFALLAATAVCAVIR